MTRCAVFGCSINNKCKKLGKFHFYRFPKTGSVLRHWIHACRRADKFNPETARVCSRHFKATDYTQHYIIKRNVLNKSPQATRSLETDAVPSLFLPNQENDSEASERRAQRAEEKQRRQLLQDLLHVTGDSAVSGEYVAQQIAPHEALALSPSGTADHRRKLRKTERTKQPDQGTSLTGGQAAESSQDTPGSQQSSIEASHSPHTLWARKMIHTLHVKEEKQEDGPADSGVNAYNSVLIKQERESSTIPSDPLCIQPLGTEVTVDSQSTNVLTDLEIKEELEIKKELEFEEEEDTEVEMDEEKQLKVDIKEENVYATLPSDLLYVPPQTATAHKDSMNSER